MDDGYGLAMVGRTRDFSMDALSEEVFDVVQNDGRMVDGVDLGACEDLGELSGKTLENCQISPSPDV